jgi:hypothetical protein
MEEIAPALPAKCSIESIFYRASGYQQGDSGNIQSADCAMQWVLTSEIILCAQQT